MRFMFMNLGISLLRYIESHKPHYPTFGVMSKVQVPTPRLLCGPTMGLKNIPQTFCDLVWIYEHQTNQHRCPGLPKTFELNRIKISHHEQGYVKFAVKSLKFRGHFAVKSQNFAVFRGNQKWFKNWHNNALVRPGHQRALFGTVGSNARPIIRCCYC